MWAFLVTLAFTLYMTGMIWSMQVFEYPLFALVGPKEFPSYHAAHNRSLPFFVILPSLLAFGSAVVLFWKPSCGKTARIYNKKSILFQYFPVSWPYNWDVKDKDCGLALLYECFTMRCLIGKKKSIMQKSVKDHTGLLVTRIK